MANNKRVDLNADNKASSPTVSKKRTRRPVSHTSSVTSLTVLRERLHHVTRWIFFGLGIVLVLSFGLVTVPNMRGGEGQAGSEVARVGKHTIQRDSFEQSLRQMKESPYLAMMGGGSGPTQDLTLRNMVLEQNIDHMLKLDAAKREGNRIGRKQLQDRIDQTIDSSIQQAKSSFKDPKDFQEKFLKLRMKVQNEQGLRDKLNKEIRKDRAWMDATREQILIDNLEQKVRKEAEHISLDKAKPEDIEVRVRQILVKTDTRSDAEAQKIATDILNQVKSGADFAKVAREKSEDDSSKAKGGDMDWLGKGGFWQGPELEKAAFDLKPGQVSNLIKTKAGYQIAKVEGRRFSPAKHWQSYTDALKKDGRIVVKDPVLQAYRQFTADEDAARQAMTAAKDDAARKKAEAAQKQSRARSIARFQKSVDKVYDPDTRASVYFIIGSLYGQENNTVKAAESFGQAAKERPAPEIYMALGDVQKKLKQTKAAVASFKLASDMASDTSSQQNYFTHMMLQQVFQELKETKFAAAENVWLAQYQKNQPAGGGMGFPGGGNFTVR